MQHYLWTFQPEEGLKQAIKTKRAVMYGQQEELKPLPTYLLATSHSTATIGPRSGGIRRGPHRKRRSQETPAPQGPRSEGRASFTFPSRDSAFSTAGVVPSAGSLDALVCLERTSSSLLDAALFRCPSPARRGGRPSWRDWEGKSEPCQTLLGLSSRTLS